MQIPPRRRRYDRLEDEFGIHSTLVWLRSRDAGLLSPPREKALVSRVTRNILESLKILAKNVFPCFSLFSRFSSSFFLLANVETRRDAQRDCGYAGCLFRRLV